MKKSEQYEAAMMAVLRDAHISDNDKLAIIETLMGDKSLAEWSEQQEEKK
jgi:hypothetical protein